MILTQENIENFPTKYLEQIDGNPEIIRTLAPGFCKKVLAVLEDAVSAPADMRMSTWFLLAYQSNRHAYHYDLPRRATNSMPGSRRKILVMRQRFRRGAELFHEDDNCIISNVILHTNRNGVLQRVAEVK